jgi:hypothetical protein
MLHFEEFRQQAHDRGQRLRRQAEAGRLAEQVLGGRRRRRRLLALQTTFGLLVRARRHAGHQGTRA